ncbi:MAG: ATP phosphoribosyltransferase regulatory subunit [Clostridia bacterium]|nr:ATP phosphoribosyltransferase regulatory subunit [Clostridia bacterium]
MRYTENSRPEPTERLVFSLRELYSSFGYKRYRMSKFEEYDFYSRNKEFLVSDQIITFTDTNGRLMALKPDVTLSIIKNSPENSGISKLFYDENVYRVTRSSGTFREIKQVGLECIGNTDPYCLSEVMYLASQTLERVSSKNALTLSHLGILGKFAASVGGDEYTTARLLECASSKNTHDIDSICVSAGIPVCNASAFKQLISLCGAPEQVVDQIANIEGAPDVNKEVGELISSMGIFKDSPVRSKIVIDFSVTGDMNYYNGIVFKGYVDGVPDSVLSGGCYDTLMRKLGKRSGAVGFAIYLDKLERLFGEDSEYDSDVMLVYEKGSDPALIRKAAEELNSKGLTVFCTPDAVKDRKCRYVCEFKDGKVKGTDGIS